MRLREGRGIVLAKLKIAGLQKSFGALEVLSGIDLEIGDGEFVCFLGPSGCGKSTLLRVIAGLEGLDEGEIILGERDISDAPSAKRDIAMVFQNYALYPHMDVYRNLSFGLSLNGMKRDEIVERVTRAAEILQIGELLKRKPRQLSGGQRQRVAIGRAIVRDPSLFLLDEPLSNLDANLRVTMRAELAALHARLGVTMIYVTHDQVEAMTLSDRVVVLDKGKVAQFGRPLELFYAPANLFVAGFIGSPRMNFFTGQVSGEGADGVDVDLGNGALIGPVALEQPSGLPAASRVTVGVRPDRLTLAEPGEGQVGGRVVLVERLGTECHVHVALENGSTAVAVTHGAHPAASGDTVSLKISPNQCHLFDPQGEALKRRLETEIAALIAKDRRA